MNQSDFLLNYFKQNPNRDIPHKEIVDWVNQEYPKQFGKPLRDPDRAIRKMSQSGSLIKVAKGIYKYDPEYITKPHLEDFPSSLKQKILERDDYKCVICGLGKKNGVELHVDHIKPKDLGGLAILENGQTLCASHNFLKKNYKQTEFGKKMFIRLRDSAIVQGDDKIVKFCEAILNVFDEFDINGHIEWKK